MPHVPLFVSKDFKGKSERGLYGDVIEEIDWSVGEILNTLKKEGLDENTVVIFTSIMDHGIFNENGGSAGPLFGAKGTGYEGGQRVPAIFWGPGKLSLESFLELEVPLIFSRPFRSWQVYRCQTIEYMMDTMFLPSLIKMIRKPKTRNDLLS